MSYALIGKRVRVHLYDRQGFLLGAVEGRVSDFSPNVDVSLTRDGSVKKDLVYVTGIEGYKNPYLPVDEQGEGWFAVQDIVVLDEGPVLNAN